MTYKMYLLHIGDLEDQKLQQVAMPLMDKYRQERVNKYAKEKDRMRAMAAGLLLQAGFLEAKPEDAVCKSIKLENGVCYYMQTGSLVRWLRKMSQSALPIPLTYKKIGQGKPAWNRQKLMHIFPDKRLWYFNLSHSGDYVVLVVADRPVGVDIQEARETKKIPGGYREFSRMEAYVKCTGEGFSRGYKTYERHVGKVPGYEFLEVVLVEGYALNLCLKKE